MVFAVEEAMAIAKLMQRRKKKKKLICMVVAYMQPETPLIPAISFSLGTYNDEKARLEFRFTIDGIVSLTSLLGLPNVVISSAGDRAQGIEAMRIILASLPYPKRYVELSNTFGRSRASLCRVFLCAINLLHAKWHHRIFLYSRLQER